MLELGNKVVAFLTCSRIVALDNTGNTVWTTLLKYENVKWVDVAHFSKSAQVIIVGKTDKTTHLLKLDAKSGNILMHQQFNDVANFEK